jgi:hypothetical protein
MTELLSSTISDEVYRLAADGLATAIVIFIVIGIKRLICKIIDRFRKEPLKDEVGRNKSIYKQLVELRAVTDADRVYVFRFHNGSEFLPNDPAWKLSCTHEEVRSGVTFELAKSQGMLVSSLQNLVSPVLTGQVSVTGISVNDCDECQYKIKCAKDGKHVVNLQVEDMEGCFGRSYLESKNNKTTILCGIAVDGNVTGMVGIDFCGVRLQNDKIKDVALKVCRSTDKIQYLLQSKKVPGDILA